MAFIAKIAPRDKKWRGPFPDKAGEFCGNHVLKDEDKVHTFTDMPCTINHANSKVYVGKPSSCVGLTSNEMSKKGFVGLYLKADDPSAHDGYAECMTVNTDNLQEAVISGEKLPDHVFNPPVPFDFRASRFVNIQRYV